MRKKRKLTDILCYIVAIVLFALFLFSCANENGYYVATETTQEDGSHYVWVE